MGLVMGVFMGALTDMTPPVTGELLYYIISS